MEFAEAMRGIGALVLTMGLIVATGLLLRRFVPGLKGREGDSIQVLATRMILPKKHVCLVRIGEKTFILGSAGDSMCLLGTIEGEVPEGSPRVD